MSDTIKRTHFMRLKAEFNQNGIQQGHRLREIPATPENVINRVAQIPWGWIKKKIYDNEVLPHRIKNQKMRVFDLVDNGKTVGYALIIHPDKDIKNSFLQSVQNQRIVEIENIALFPGEAGKGRGKSFLNLIQQTLFQEGYDAVYLNTSATNHPTLPEFYRRCGMTDLGQAEVANFNNRVRKESAPAA